MNNDWVKVMWDAMRKAQQDLIDWRRARPANQNGAVKR